MADAPRCFESSPQGHQENEDFPGETASLHVQHFECLPDVIKKRIASFLPQTDAFALSLTCRTVHSDLSLTFLDLGSVWPRRLSWDCHRGDPTGDIPKRGPKLPTAPFSSAHSVTLACTYRDQGWGSRKGRLYIVGHRRRSGGREEEYACDPNDISQGRIVAQSPVADHENTSLRLSFCPREDEAYHLWYKVGRGGGHQLLHVWNARQIVVVCDDASRSMREAFRYLSSLFKPPSFIVSGENRDDGAVAFAVEQLLLLLPQLTATLQSLTKIKEACNNCDSSSSSVAMLEETHEPILAHLRERGLDTADDKVLLALRNMIPRAQLASSIIKRNFIHYAIHPSFPSPFPGVHSFNNDLGDDLDPLIEDLQDDHAAESVFEETTILSELAWARGNDVPADAMGDFVAERQSNVPPQRRGIRRVRRRLSRMFRISR